MPLTLDLCNFPPHLPGRDFRVRVFGVIEVKDLHVLLWLIRKDRLNDAAFNDYYDHGSILHLAHHGENRLAVVAGTDVGPEPRIIVLEVQPVSFVVAS